MVDVGVTNGGQVGTKASARERTETQVDTHSSVRRMVEFVSLAGLRRCVRFLCNTFDPERSSLPYRKVEATSEEEQ